MGDSLADLVEVVRIRKVAVSYQEVDNRLVADRNYSPWSADHNLAASLRYIPVAEKYWVVHTDLVGQEYMLIPVALDNLIQDSGWCIEQGILAEKAAVDNLADLYTAVGLVQSEAL